MQGTANPVCATYERWQRTPRRRFRLRGVEGAVLLILVAGVRARSEFDASNVLTWLFAAGFGATALATAALYIRMELRARQRSL